MIGLYSANSQSGVGFTGLLDEYGGAAAAYSVRRLSGSYSGALIEVRRSSDNTVQDIGYDANGNLDTTALLSFVGAEDGFVRTWYDQSGNANNAQQTTTSNQPQIVSSGSLVLENSKPAFDYLGSRFLDADGAASLFSGQADTINHYIFTVAASKGSLDDWILGLAALSGNTTFMQIRTNGVDNLRAVYRTDSSGSNDNTTTESINAQSLIGSYGVPANFDLYKNGRLVKNATNAVINAQQFTFGRMSIGNTARAISGLIWNGTIQEVVMYNSDQSTNVTGIESNINTYFSIY